ncbi:hypothetical protein [Telluribacter sp.]|jgi:amino acid permease|uniref:hypothetical protein n=1 Tax=Telluribacter sp. TaxID=1978767 RepID=UPI002E0DF74B|nr:hypothetical protein [Telluribacter sp.]
MRQAKQLTVTRQVLYRIGTLLGACGFTGCQYMAYTSSKLGVWGGTVMLVVALSITVYIVSRVLKHKQ